jgi:hypothetical protein
LVEITNHITTIANDFLMGNLIWHMLIMI